MLLATSVYLPLWLAIVLGVVVLVAFLGTLGYSVDCNRLKNRWEKKARKAEERCSVLENNKDQKVICKIISESVDGHATGNEMSNIMRSAYESHYGQYKEAMVNGFMDRSSKMMGELADDLTDKLMASVQPIFNDMGGEGTFILPNGVKHAFQKGNSLVVLIENSAGVRSTTFTANALEKSDLKYGKKVAHSSDRYEGHVDCYRFNLSFPFTYFLFTFRLDANGRYSYQKFNIFFRNDPLTSIQQSLYPAPLLNMGMNGEEGYVCMGDSTSTNVNYKSLSQMCDELIAEWWSRAFHNDLNAIEFRNSPVGNVSTWAKKSEIDPFWACKQKWKNGIKVKRILGKTLVHEGQTMPSVDCRIHVEAAAYEMTKQINHTIEQLKPETYMTADAFEPAAKVAFKNSLTLLTNQIIGRIT